MFHYHNSFIQSSLSQNVLWTNDRVLENTSSFYTHLIMQYEPMSRGYIWNPVFSIMRLLEWNFGGILPGHKFQ